MDAYGENYQEIRQQRLTFCNGECELALLGRDTCKDYNVECHHKDSESYRRCRLGLATINDVIVVCKQCHDMLTNFQRRERYSGRSLSVESLPETPMRLRHGLERIELEVDRNQFIADEKRPNRRSIEQVRKGI